MSKVPTMTDHLAGPVFETEPMVRTYCPACRSENTAVSYRDGDGHLYCRCLSCACRFWGA